MDIDVLFSSEHIKITKVSDEFYIESFKTGMSVEQFNKLMSEHPEIRITSFVTIKNALLFPPKPPTKFGDVKERFTIEISEDELRAYITLCVTPEELLENNKPKLFNEIIKRLSENGIVFGIKQESIVNNLCNGKKILAAEGIPPENGEDSIVQMYELKEAKPEVKEDGNVDHYELNLINTVEQGEWLGERRDATEGAPGKSVKGNAIPPVPGKKYPLTYDKKTVKETCENGVTTLRALIKGAVHYDGSKIGVSNHLEITDDVDFKTGNIDFDGYLTVKGTVEDGFSVSAQKDIEILGVYGVGSIREVVSRDGSIYIKGGIAGKNKAVIKSHRDIYTKFVSDATIICEGSVYIGFYCLNSNIIAKQVILDSPKSQIIGGNIEAEIKVVSSVIGSPSEKRTCITVKGFNRQILIEQLERVVTESENLKNDLNRCKQEISVYTSSDNLTREQSHAFEKVQDRFFELKDELKRIEQEKRALATYLRTHGEGEIVVHKRVYPNTFLQIKGSVREIWDTVLSTSFYIQDEEIKEL